MHILDRASRSTCFALTTSSAGAFNMASSRINVAIVGEYISRKGWHANAR